MRVDKTIRIPNEHASVSELARRYDTGDMRATMPAWISRPYRVWREIDDWLGAFFEVNIL